jgi:glycosyltransferase involved in cell wall biosynthesis
MRCCAALGHEVSLALATEPKPEALQGLDLRALYRLDQANANGWRESSTWLQKKFRSFFGVPEGHLSALAAATRDTKADAVIIAGLNVLPYFAAVENAKTVWYAADELAWHHLSQLKLGDPDFVANIRNAALKAVYERAHRNLIDRAWVVSDTERRAMTWLAGMKGVDIIPLGIDGTFFAPGNETVRPHSATFWGRLDFGPNIQALEWFIPHVWPLVRQEVPGATFTVMGFNPSDAVRAAVAAPGVTLMPNVPDLRSVAREHAVAVFPFVSGGGTKNKLLEAAALGLPIVCTPTATLGLLGDELPLSVTTGPKEFAAALVRAWSDPQKARASGRDAREWVLREHAWEAMARTAMATLEGSELAA